MSTQDVCRQFSVRVMLATSRRKLASVGEKGYGNSNRVKKLPGVSGIAWAASSYSAVYVDTVAFRADLQPSYDGGVARSSKMSSRYSRDVLKQICLRRSPHN